MDWIKVKVNHVLYEYNDLTFCQFGAWIKAMALTAVLEKLPTESQLIEHIHKRTLNSLETKLKIHRTSLETILKKVLEDVQKVQNTRQSWKEKKALQREKSIIIDTLSPKTSPKTSQDCPSTDKIREDKRREESPLPPKGSSGGTLEYLLKTWKVKNPLEARSRKLVDCAERELSAALARNIPAIEIESVLWDTSGKGIKPWELFKNASKKQNVMEQAQKTIEKMEAMGL